ncbi:MAG TPA: hypothetical protein VJJ81_02135, partial [Candidatus Babeliales bacterium]|nr:hypothetical protein [Candidatus Babeliales bacterium]
RQLEARAAGNLAEAKWIARIMDRLDAATIDSEGVIVPLHSATSVNLATLLGDVEFLDSVKFYDLTRASKR